MGGGSGGVGGSRLRLLHLLLVGISALLSEPGACSAHTALGRAPSTYLCNLHTPVEQVLGADVVLVLADVVQEAAKGHELCDQLDCGGEADAQEAADMWIVHTGHHVGFLWGGAESRTLEGLCTVAEGRGRQTPFQV